MGEEEQQTEDSGDLSEEDDAVESEGGENIDLMKLDTKKNPKQKKFRLLTSVVTYDPIRHCNARGQRHLYRQTWQLLQLPKTQVRNTTTMNLST